MTILQRLLANAAAIWIATALIGGVDVDESEFAPRVATFLLIAAIFGLVNALIKPVVKVLALPLVILTLGLLTLVLNGLLFWFTGWLADTVGLSFEVDGFWPAFWGAIVVSIISGLASVVIDDDRDRDTRAARRQRNRPA